MLNKKKVILISLISVFAICAGVFSVKNKDKGSKSSIMTAGIEYIEIPSTGKKLYIKKVKPIKPALWKGSYDGILHYKDGSSVEINVSSYGDFFGTKGEDRSLDSDGIYKYELSE